MNRDAEFDKAFEKLNQELDTIAGREFFAMFGINIDDLPVVEVKQ